MVSLAQVISVPSISEYVTIQEAADDDRVPYTAYWLRKLARDGKIEAVKVGQRTRGQWLLHLPSLLEYIAEMDSMGAQKFNPWES